VHAVENRHRRAAGADTGELMLQVIDPSVADESDPASVVPELDMYNPDNGWTPVI